MKTTFMKVKHMMSFLLASGVSSNLVKAQTAATVKTERFDMDPAREAHHNCIVHKEDPIEFLSLLLRGDPI